MEINKNISWSMFDRIAPTYDKANRWLSLGIDRYWRRRLVAQLPKDAAVIVDLGTGTGDVLGILAIQFPEGQCIGIDPSEGMLALAEQKLSNFRNITLQVGHSQSVLLESGSVDALTMAFAIRNVPDVAASLSEMIRILKPGGVACVLEFSIPKSRVIRLFYLIYFRYVLPWLGGLISGDRDAYRYLNVTVEGFPYGDKFTALMTDSGFRNIRIVPLTFGIASIYVGER